MTAETFRDEDMERRGECLYGGDFADFKLNAEVMLRGTCYAPGERPVTESPVKLSVGAWSKTLRVVGRRVWSDGFGGAAISEPIPFTKMPIDYASAFGGPGYAPNPVGKGLGTSELPTVELARELVRSRGDRPTPASFGPINPAWPQRAGKVGKEYGRAYLKKRAPFYAEDFDWTYFQSAPPDQQLPGYLRGDEEIVLHNLHPRAPVFSAQLPGLRIRVFVNDVNGRFREARMNLDTLFLDPDAETIFLTWRGSIRSSTRRWSTSPPSSWPPSSSARRRSPRRTTARRSRRTRLIRSSSARTRPRTRWRSSRCSSAAPRRPIRTPRPRRIRSAAASAASSTCSISRSAVASSARWPAASPRSAARPARTPGSWRPSEKAVAAVPPPGRGRCCRGSPAPSLPCLSATSSVRPAPRWPTPRRRPRRGAATSAGSRRSRRCSGILGSPRSIRACARARSPIEPGPGRDLSGRNFTGADLRGRDLRGASFDGSILTRADLSGACLAGADLSHAVLYQANLEGADLSSANLTLANLTEAHAASANFSRAALVRTYAEKTSFRGADFSAATGEFLVFADVDLTDAKARGVRLFKALFRGGDLTRFDLAEAALTRCHFLGVRAVELRLLGAHLDHTNFTESDLSRARLGDARGAGSIWRKAVLDGADLSYVVLPAAHFSEASADSARFFGANLKGARFDRASLEGADFTRSNLFGADLSRALVTAARFIDANLYDAKLTKAAGAGCDFTGANLKRSTLENA